MTLSLVPPHLQASPVHSIPPPAHTRAGQHQRLAEDGFLVVPGLCDDYDIALIRTLLIGLFTREAGRAEGNLVDMLGPDLDHRQAIQPQLLKPSLYAPGLLLTRYFRLAQKLARETLGDAAEFSFDHSILQHPGPHAATPWHQDEAHDHDPHFRREQVSFWLPLQDVDEANGCLRYIPGSQRGALLPHRMLGSDPRIHALEVPAKFVRDDQARAVPLSAGCSVMHSGRTLHSSLANTSDRDRLAYVLVFQGPPVARSAALHFEWLREQRTAAAARRRHWIWQGGAAVLALRWCRRIMQSDRATLMRRLRLRLRRLTGPRPQP